MAQDFEQNRLGAPRKFEGRTGRVSLFDLGDRLPVQRVPPPSTPQATVTQVSLLPSTR